MMTNFLKKEIHLGLGCWSFGGTQWNGQAESDSLDAMQVCFDAGIRHFDTAAGYGKGESERIVGRFMKGKREDIFLATKGRGGKEGGSKALIRGLEKSLERLNTDCVDLFYIHWPNSDSDMRPLIEALEVEREKGRIRMIGVSNFTPEQISQCKEVGTIDALQHGYSLVWRRDEASVMPYCREQQIPLVTYSSLGQGILTGKFPRHPKLEGDDVRKTTVLFEADVWPLVYEATESMKEVAESVGRPLAHLAIQWTMRRAGVIAVLIGARNKQQALQNTTAVADPVSQDVLDQLTIISDSLASQLPNAKNIFRLNT